MSEIDDRVEAFLAPFREQGLAAERANRAAALNAAERYATWIQTGEDHDLVDLPPVDF